MLSVEIVDSIRGVDAREWDRLADGEVLASHGWLKAVEESRREDLGPRYVLIRQTGRLVAATTCCRSHPTAAAPDPDDLLFGRFGRVATRWGLSLRPARVLGFPSGPGIHFLIDGTIGPPERRTLVAKLLDSVEAIAATENSGIFLWNVRADDTELLAPLERRRFHGTLFFPACYLDLVWPSFDDYVAHLKKFRNMPRNVRREIEACRRAGVTIEPIEEAGSHRAALHELANRHWIRYNDDPFPYDENFFPRVQAYLGSAAVILGAFKDSALIGFMLMLNGRREGHALEIGVERGAAASAATYFNLAYYVPIRRTIGSGLERLYFGRGLPEVKIRRGCKRQDTLLMYRAHGNLRNLALRPLFFFHSLWLRRKIAAQSRAARDGSFSRPRRRRPPVEANPG